MLQNATFLLLDAARIGPGINEARERNQVNESLYRGTGSERLSSVAPYLFQFAYQTTFANWYLKNGWGESWGILVRSAYPLQALHKHFRRFLMVQSETGQKLYFRFYDPRVLRIFLPTCSREQLLDFFGGVIDYFIVEDKDPAFGIRYRHENGVLQTDRVAVGDLIAALPVPEPLPARAADEALLPETIEALREQGKLEEVQAAMAGGKPPDQTAAAQAPPATDTHAPKQKPAPVSGDEPVPQKPSKWKMFD